MDVNCIDFEAYFERHCVALLCVLCAFFIGFSHFGNKILHCFTQDPKTRKKTSTFHGIMFHKEQTRSHRSLITAVMTKLILFFNIVHSHF